MIPGLLEPGALAGLAGRAGLRGSRTDGPDTHVIGLQAQPDATPQPQRRDVGARQLHAAGRIEHRELLVDRPRPPRRRPPERLRAGPTVADGDGPLDVLRDERIVGDDEDRRAELTVRVPEERPEEARWRRAVELAGGLVGQEHRRPVASATATATRRCSPPDRRPDDGPPSVEPHEGEQRRDVAATLRRGHAVEQHRDPDVLDRGQVREEVARRLPPDDADDPPAVVGALRLHPGQVVAGHDGAPGRGQVEPAEDAHERRLAAPGRADDRHDLATLDDELQALEGHDLEVRDLEDPDQVLAHDDRDGPCGRLPDRTLTRSPPGSRRRPARGAEQPGQGDRERGQAEGRRRARAAARRVEVERDLERRPEQDAEPEGAVEQQEQAEPEAGRDDQGDARTGRIQARTAIGSRRPSPSMRRCPTSFERADPARTRPTMKARTSTPPRTRTAPPMTISTARFTGRSRIAAATSDRCQRDTRSNGASVARQGVAPAWWRGRTHPSARRDRREGAQLVQRDDDECPVRLERRPPVAHGSDVGRDRVVLVHEPNGSPMRVTPVCVARASNRTAASDAGSGTSSSAGKPGFAGVPATSGHRRASRQRPGHSPRGRLPRPPFPGRPGLPRHRRARPVTAGRRPATRPGGRLPSVERRW